MKKRALSWRERFWLREIAGALAALLVVAIPLLGPIRQNRSGPKPTSLPIAAPPNGPGSLEELALPWYIRSGQWRADVRSLVAALHYLAQSDSPQQTNLMPPKRIRLESAVRSPRSAV